MDLWAEKKKYSSLEETDIFWMLYSTWSQILADNFVQNIEKYRMIILWQFCQNSYLLTETSKRV